MMGIGLNHHELAVGGKVFLSAAILVGTPREQEKLLPGNKKRYQKMHLFHKMIERRSETCLCFPTADAKNMY